MENDKITVTTMPLSPKVDPGIEYELIPVVTEIVSSFLKCRGIVAINLLDSRRNREQRLEPYLSNLKKMQYALEVMLDIDALEIMKKRITELIDKGVVMRKRRNIHRCQCGCVELLESTACRIKNPINFLYDGQEIICNLCKKKSRLESREVLVMQSPYITCTDDITVFPEVARNDVVHYIRELEGQEILVSRYRKTGIAVCYDLEEFHIDIDFAMALYHDAINTEKILITSNHQSYYVYLSYILNFVLDKQSITYIEIPYLLSDENLKKLSGMGVNEKKLALLGSLKWSVRNISVGTDVLNFISKRTQDEVKAILTYAGKGGTEGVRKKDESVFDYTVRVLKYGLRIGDIRKKLL